MRKTWLSDVIHTEKAAIGVVHFKAFPSDPLYDPTAGMEGIVEAARRDLIALQNGGIDAVLFSNEFSFPYEPEPWHGGHRRHGLCDRRPEKRHPCALWSECPSATPMPRSP